jgi:hypothetical protein
MREAAALSLTAALLCGQEAIHTGSATQPGAGRVLLREQLHWYHSDSAGPGGGTRIDELLLDSSLTLGVRQDLALDLSMPTHLSLTDAAGATDDDLELGDLQVLAKCRLFRRDSGPIDTERASLILGVQCDTASRGATSLRPDFARDSFDPILGAVWTRIDGRVGLDAAVQATISASGDPSDFRYDGAWLYRLSPATFGPGIESGWYLVAELNGRYQTNGDHEVLLAPGLLIETRRISFELSVQLPAYQDLAHRPEIDYAVVVGMRFLF